MCKPLLVRIFFPLDTAMIAFSAAYSTLLN